MTFVRHEQRAVAHIHPPSMSCLVAHFDGHGNHAPCPDDHEHVLDCGYRYQHFHVDGQQRHEHTLPTESAKGEADG